MSTTSKSPRKVLLVAHAAAREALPAYAHRFAPKKYTQPRLLALLVLKAHRGKKWDILNDEPTTPGTGWCK